jgi:hypothetical protein
VNQEIKKLWVAALRSGEYKQAIGMLRRGGSFCCLGVLCNLHAQAHPDIAAMQHNSCYYMGEGANLPRAVGSWAELYLSSRMVSIRGANAALSFHNDNGRTFAEIADAIEAQL